MGMYESRQSWDWNYYQNTVGYVYRDAFDMKSRVRDPEPTFKTTGWTLHGKDAIAYAEKNGVMVRHSTSWITPEEAKVLTGPIGVFVWVEKEEWEAWNANKR